MSWPSQQIQTQIMIDHENSTQSWHWHAIFIAKTTDVNWRSIQQLLMLHNRLIYGAIDLTIFATRLRAWLLSIILYRLNGGLNTFHTSSNAIEQCGVIVGLDTRYTLSSTAINNPHCLTVRRILPDPPYTFHTASLQIQFSTDDIICKLYVTNIISRKKRNCT